MDGGSALRWLAVAGLGHTHQWGSKVTVDEEVECVGALQRLLPADGERSLNIGY